MDAVLNWLWQGVVVAMAAAAMLRLLDRSRAAVRCVVCWIALLVVVALPLMPIALAGFVAGAPTVSTAPLITVPNVWWTSGALLAGFWVIWCGIFAVRIAGAVVVVRRTRAHSEPFPPAVAASLSHWQRLRGTGRPARLVLSDRVRAAAVLGGGAPVIAVARALAARLDANELDGIIVHEWAHVQRRDDLATIGRLIVRAVMGWHPAACWLDRRLALEQELACDEMVVAVSGGAKSYASCLVKLASCPPAQRDVLLAPGALSSAGITRRVARLVTRRDFASSTWSRRAAAVAVSLLVVLALAIAPVRIVEAAVAATVVRVLRPVANVAPDHLAPASDQQPAPARRERRQSAPLPAAVQQTIADPAPVAIPDPSPSAAQAYAETEPEAAPEPETLTIPGGAASPPLPVSTPPAAASKLQVDDGARSAWSQAADAGVAIGRGSTKAGVATAGAFTRFAKTIAGSF